ncbi:MAG TPA: head GIN domain-containing protein, partial [Thermomicrobiaceae bacterium]|nr:head GIN domain-containing protein [Thermomicrobiaceae bacterium]
LALGALVAGTACQVSFARGSGNVVSESRQVSGFDRVSLGGIGNLLITQGDQESLTIDAEDNVLPHITTNVSGGQLSIGYDTQGLNWVQPTKPVDFHLTVKNLQEIDLGGSGSIQTSGLRANQLTVKIGGSGNGTLNGLVVTGLDVEIAGSGSIVAAGTADSQQLRIAGSGNYRAPDLATQSTQITVTGSGNSVVNVARTLSVSITGRGSVQYSGSPTIDQHILGSGRITKLP